MSWSFRHVLEFEHLTGFVLEKMETVTANTSLDLYSSKMKMKTKIVKMNYEIMEKHKKQ